MSTIAVGAHRAQPIVTLTPGVKLALQAFVALVVLFLLSSGYGYAERNIITDVVTVVTTTWTLATSPWTYAFAAAGGLLAKVLWMSYTAAPAGAHRA
jgi:hypothetical protein